MFIKRKPLVVCDIEVSPNAYLVGFKSIEKGKVIQIEAYGEDVGLDKESRKKLRSILSKYTIVTFNGERYDVPVMLKSLQGITCKQIFKMSEEMIRESYPAWQSIRNFAIEGIPGMTHIDLSQPAPGVMVSLKLYGARLHSKKLQDLPYEYDIHLNKQQYEVWKKYNINDLDTTIDLYNEIAKAIELRYNMSDNYKLDLMSKGDAQIAEAVVIYELGKKNIRVKKVSLPSSYKVIYKAPDFVRFMSDQLNTILERIQEEPFELDGKGSPKIPDWLKKETIQLGETTYNIGLGGLHSQEKKLVVLSDDTHVMRNADVASYYPSMIIEYDYTPKHLGKHFLEVYKGFYWSRNHPVTGSKVRGDKVSSDSTKLTLNGVFGKLGSKWSKLYSPDLMLQVTITGQLMLLMLIEELESKGFKVVSSNTDGIEYFCDKDRQDEAEAIIYDWELETGMVMEHGVYEGLYARDVNNYVAIYDGYAKAKGAYTDSNIRKNVEYPIVYNAIKKYLIDGTSFTDTIDKCDTITEFIVCKKVTGGAEWRSEYLGKVVRWYYSTDGDPITYVKNGNKVGKSDGSKPIMDLPDNNEIPNDLDKEYYIELAIKHLSDLGVNYEH